MIDAQTLVTTGAGASSVILFSPWFQRGGDYATFTAEAVALAGTGAKLTVRAFHKNAEDTGDGVDVNSATTIELTTATRTPATWPVQDTSTVKGFKQLVRYQFKLEATSGTAYATFRMLSPIWFDNVKAW
ncbi:MAG: hypothetical protein IPK26_31890 [Planctomycetes bacterium]|nr:hypothetical protein [Planctomycetota bacterium]